MQAAYFDQYLEKLSTSMRELRAEKDQIKASELNGAAGVKVT